MQRIRSSDIERHAAFPGRLSASLRTRVWGIATVSAALLMSCSPAAHPEGLEQVIRQPWTLYVFVSTGMPHQTLVGLAREAARTHAAMVFRGFPGGAFDLAAEQRLVGQLNEECCSDPRIKPSGAGGSNRLTSTSVVPAWSIDPALYQRFDVGVVPTFVLAAAGDAGERTFSKVSGDMALASALKYFAQRSTVAAVRDQAVSVYQRAYGGYQ